VWLSLVGVIGGELFYAFGLFNFVVLADLPFGINL